MRNSVLDTLVSILLLPFVMVFVLCGIIATSAIMAIDMTLEHVRK